MSNYLETLPLEMLSVILEYLCLDDIIMIGNIINIDNILRSNIFKINKLKYENLERFTKFVNQYDNFIDMYKNILTFLNHIKIISQVLYSYAGEYKMYIRIYIPKFLHNEDFNLLNINLDSIRTYGNICKESHQDFIPILIYDDDELKLMIDDEVLNVGTDDIRIFLFSLFIKDNKWMEKYAHYDE